jgi:hypothetical protein
MEKNDSTEPNAVFEGAAQPVRKVLQDLHI